MQKQEINQRIESWKKQLLDLTKRNILLDFKEEKGSKILVLDFTKNELFFDEKNSDYFLKLNKLYKQNKEIEKETGNSVTHLAIGFLSWNEKKTENLNITPDFKAPLFLIPLKITKEKNSSKYNFDLNFEEIIFNHTLQEKLKKDFDINLNFLNLAFNEINCDSIDIDLQIKEKIDEIKKIIKISLDESISFDKNYQITNEVYLANFSFSRYSIYKELEENSEFFQEQEILKYLFDRNNIDHRNDHNLDFSEDSEKNPRYFIDEKYSEKDLFTVLPADSSQLKAILLASSGNSFVLQGPPGTGKSQTITNIIAQLIANGKSILFVSAKMAALDVVYEKLKDVKLNDFCLKLNISSSNGEGISKKDALKQLENAWSKGKNMNNFSFRAIKRKVLIF